VCVAVRSLLRPLTPPPPWVHQRSDGAGTVHWRERAGQLTEAGISILSNSATSADGRYPGDHATALSAFASECRKTSHASTAVTLAEKAAGELSAMSREWMQQSVQARDEAARVQTLMHQ
jgi:hypothetical protein